MPVGAMQTEDAVNELLRVLLADREAGRTRSTLEYQALLPGFGDLVEHELERLAGGPCTENARFGPYELLEELGRGAQGRVFRARDTRLGRIVALKTMNAVAGLSPAGRARFGREAEIVSKLEHPGICTVFEAGEEEGVPFIAMRFLPGETLAKFLAREKAPPSTRAELERVLGWIEEAARAVHAAHTAGIVHRDIKPGNVMLTADGHAVLLDFGTAHDVDGKTLTLTGDLFGTPAYMAPEQIAGSARLLDHQVDVHALGVTLYECLTRELPFQGANRETLFRAILTRPAPDPRRINPHLPRDARAVLEKALEKEPRRRYATALELAEELARLRHGAPVRARAITRPERVWRWARREPLRAGLLAAALLAAGLGLYLGTSWDEIQAAEEQARALQRQAWIDQGFDELATGDVSRAAELFRQALEVPPTDPEAMAGLLLSTGDHELSERYPEVFASYPELDWVLLFVDERHSQQDPSLHALYERLAASRSPLAVFIEGLGSLQGVDLGVSNTGRMGYFLVHTLIESKHARQLLRYRDQFQDFVIDESAPADPARHLIRVIEAPEGDRVVQLPLGQSVGDVDGDGHADLLVSYARGYPDAAAFVLLVSGKTGGLLRTYSAGPIPPPQPFEAGSYNSWRDGGFFVLVGPDLDADSVREHLLVGQTTEIRSGREGTPLGTILLGPGQDWGWPSVSGDVDGDGVADLLLPVRGGVEVFSLTTRTKLFRIEAPGMEPLDKRACLLGDLDGDGAPELLAGGQQDDVRGLDSGCCYAYSYRDGRASEQRSPALLVRRYPGCRHQEQFGNQLGPLGDIDGDGAPDFFASAWYASEKSFHNGIVRAVSGADGRELWLAAGPTPLADFGRAVALLDDVDGDATPEVIVGARRSSRNGQYSGAFSVLSGRTGRSLLEIEGAGTWDGLGSHVAPAGDVNGDGHPDVLVAEHFPGDPQDVGERPPRPILERAYVYSVVPLR